MPPMKLKEDIARTRPLIIESNGLGMYRIAVEGGGMVPIILRGLFTNEGNARVVLDRYNSAT